MMTAQVSLHPATDPATDDPAAGDSRTADPRDDDLPWDERSPMALDLTPWSVRRVRGSGMPALEIYEAGRLADIVVTTSVTPQILRGARRVRSGAQVLVLAWGRLAADGNPVAVTFAAGRRRQAAHARAEVIEVAGLAWFATAAGRYSVVSARHRDGCERLRFGAGPLW
jgi:hypothetical protein